MNRNRNRNRNQSEKLRGVVPLRVRQAHQEAARPVAVPRLQGAAAAVAWGGRGGGLEGRCCERVVRGELKLDWTGSDSDSKPRTVSIGKTRKENSMTVMRQEERGREGGRVRGQK